MQNGARVQVYQRPRIGSRQRLRLVQAVNLRLLQVCWRKWKQQQLDNCAEISTTHSAIREPTGWQQIWTDKNSGNDCDYNVWLPIAPPDYVALGVFCKSGFITIIRQVRVRLQVLWWYINHLDKNRFEKRRSLE